MITDKNGNNDVAIVSSIPTQQVTIAQKIEYARYLAESGLLPTHFRKNPANILFAYEYAQMLGLAPMAAITGIHVIEGKPSASAALMSALVRRAGHRLRITGNDEKATAEIVRSDDPDFVFRSEWTIARARQAGLASKPVWKNYPAAMLKARAISECARDACEEVLCGLHYTPEELGVDVDGEGQPVQATATRVTAEGNRNGRDWNAEIAQREAADDLSGLKRLWDQIRRDDPTNKEALGLIRAAVTAIKDRTEPVESNENGATSAEIADDSEMPVRPAEPPVEPPPTRAAPSEPAPTAGLTDADWDAAIEESVAAGDLEGLYGTYHSALVAEPENTELHERIKAAKPQALAVIGERSGEQDPDAASPDDLDAEQLAESRTRDELRKRMFKRLGEGGITDTAVGRATRLLILNRLLVKVPAVTTSDGLTDLELAKVIVALEGYRREGRLVEQMEQMSQESTS